MKMEAYRVEAYDAPIPVLMNCERSRCFVHNMGTKNIRITSILAVGPHRPQWVLCHESVQVRAYMEL